MPKRRILVLPILALLFALMAALPAIGAPLSTPSGHVLVFLLEGVHLDEILDQSCNNISRMVSKGAVGYSSTRTTGALMSEKILLTVSAGNQCTAGPEAANGYNINETYLNQPVNEIFSARTGSRVPEKGAVALDIAAIWRRTADSNNAGLPGLLGDTLRKNGVRTAAVGNSDSVETIRRLGILLAMDGAGRVDFGAVGSEILVSDPGFPSGFRTDPGRMLSQIQKVWNQAGLIVIEHGDLARVENARDVLLDRVIPLHRASALKAADAVLGSIMEIMDPKRDLLIVAGVVPASDVFNQGDRLAPVLMYGWGMEPGLLSSSTTRTPGLVTPEDLTATIMDFFKVSATTAIVGRPLRSINGSVENLQKAHAEWVSVEQQRRPILEVYVYLLIVGILGSAVLILFWPGAVRLAELARFLLIGLASAPLVFLILPFFHAGTLLTAGFLSIIIAAAISGAIRIFFKNPVDALALVTGATAVALLADILLGGFLLHRSLLSYSPMVGARFYGIGNEYAGILLGASIVAGTTVLDRFPRFQRRGMVILGVVFAVIAAAIALPGFGADFGGAISAVAGFVITMVMVRGRRLRTKELLVAFAGVAVIVVILVVNELLRGPEQMTHLGRAFSGILQDGPGGFLILIRRKIEMNLRLFRYTYWTWVLVAFLFILPILFKRPPHVLARVFAAHPILRKGFIGSVFTSLVALVVNDSGVVAAATCMIYAGIGLIYMVLDEVGTRERALCATRDEV